MEKSRVKYSGLSVDSKTAEKIRELARKEGFPSTASFIRHLIEIYPTIRRIKEMFDSGLLLLPQNLQKQLNEASQDLMSTLSKSSNYISVKNILPSVQKGNVKVWIAVTSDQNYRLCANHGIWGVNSPQGRAQLSKVKIGDLLVFYIKRHGVLRDIWKICNTMYYNNTKIWPNKLYPWRINIKSLLSCSISVNNLINQLSFIKNKNRWYIYFHREMIELDSNDGATVIRSFLSFCCHNISNNSM